MTELIISYFKNWNVSSYKGQCIRQIWLRKKLKLKVGSPAWLESKNVPLE